MENQIIVPLPAPSQYLFDDLGICLNADDDNIFDLNFGSNFNEEAIGNSSSYESLLNSPSESSDSAFSTESANNNEFNVDPLYFFDTFSPSIPKRPKIHHKNVIRTNSYSSNSDIYDCRAAIHSNQDQIKYDQFEDIVVTASSATAAAVSNNQCYANINNNNNGTSWTSGLKPNVSATTITNGQQNFYYSVIPNCTGGNNQILLVNNSIVDSRNDGNTGNQINMCDRSTAAPARFTQPQFIVTSGDGLQTLYSVNTIDQANMVDQVKIENRRGDDVISEIPRYHPRRESLPNIRPKVENFDGNNKEVSDANISIKHLLERASITTISPNCTTISPNSYVQDGTVNKEMDARQYRIIKNREAAYLSRKRKKEYMESIETKLKSYSTENEKLKRENNALRSALENLKQENEELKTQVSSKTLSGISRAVTKRILSTGGNRRSICVLSFLLICCVNLGSYWNSYSPIYLAPAFSASRPNIDKNFFGRKLLSVDDGSSDYVVLDGDHSKMNTDFDSAGVRYPRSVEGGPNFNDSSNPDCNAYVNSTESMRVADELQRWLLLYKNNRAAKTLKEDSDQSKSAYHHLNNKRMPPNLLNRNSRNYNANSLNNRIRNQETNGDDEILKDFYSSNYDLNEQTYRRLNRFYGFRQNLEFDPDFEERRYFERAESYRKYVDLEKQFLKAFNGRRNDTLYFVSFQDYILLPADSYNKTSRPRMSLLMPVVPFNESAAQPFSNNPVTMMQIECEVISLMQLPEMAIIKQKNGKTKLDNVVAATKRRQNASNKRTDDILMKNNSSLNDTVVSRQRPAAAKKNKTLLDSNGTRAYKFNNETKKL